MRLIHVHIEEYNINIYYYIRMLIGPTSYAEAV